MSTTEAEAAFTRAKKTYVELLSAKERLRITAPTTLSDLITQAKSISDTLKQTRQTQSGHWSSDLGEIATKLKPFERLLEAVCKFPFQGGELVWSSVAFVLETARNNVVAFDQVMDFFLTMAEEMEYVKSLDNAFRDKTLIAPVIEALYIAILAFWVKAVKYYRRELLKRASFFSLLVHFTSSSYMVEKFQQLKAEITKHKSRLHQAADVQHAVDSANFFQQARRRDLVEWINAPSYLSDFMAADKLRLNGTCEWVADRQEYRDFLQGSANLFVIYGIPGAGKTVLSNWLIRQARSDDQGNIVLYHFFKATDNTKNNLLSPVRSFIDQLYEHLYTTQHVLLPDLESKLSGLSLKRQVESEQLWGVFSFMLSRLSEGHQAASSFTTTIILDAVDECKESGAITRNLVDLARSVPIVKIIVTARKSGEHAQQVSLVPDDRLVILEIGPYDIHHDICSFIHHKISSMERLHDQKHSSLRHTILKRLGNIAHHQGMFLWVYFMCREIEQQLKVSDIHRLLDNLPKGLGAMYALICQRLAGTLNAQHLEFSQQVLQWVITSSRPLCFAELESALRTAFLQASPSSHDNFFDEQDELLWSRKDLVVVCGDLVVYSGLDDGDTIRPVHLSVQQFLQTSITDLASAKELATYQSSVSAFLVDVPRTQCSIARTCLFYLSSRLLQSSKHLKLYVGFFNAESYAESKATFTKTFPFFVYAAVYWLDFVVKILPTIQNSQEANLDVSVLLSEICDFIKLPDSGWAEECIGELGIEYVFSLIHQLSYLYYDLMSDEIVRWATKILQTLSSHGQTLSRVPRMARICLSSLSDTEVPVLHSQLISGFELDSPKDDSPHPLSEHPPMESLSRPWMHYDPNTDRLYSVEMATDVIQLRCQVLSTGIRLRPAAMDAPESGQSYIFCFAAASVNTRYIAATYVSGGDYCTICWRIATRSLYQLSPTSHFAEVVISDTMEFFHVKNFRGKGSRGILAFDGDQRLFTPRGVWDLRTLKRANEPVELFSSSSQPESYDACFSESGQHFAVMRRFLEYFVLERLDIGGRFLSKHTFSDFDSVDLLKLSRSGEKAVLCFVRANVANLFCFIFEDEKRIRLAISRNLDCGRNLATASYQFTNDEERLLACHHYTGTDVVVWSLIKECGRYRDEVQAVCVFRATIPYGLAFCLMPSRSTLQFGNPPSILVTTDLGNIATALTDKECESSLLDTYVGAQLMVSRVAERGGLKVLFHHLQSRWTGEAWTRVLKSEQWLLTSRSPELMQSCIMEDVPHKRFECLRFSYTGQFLISGVRTPNLLFPSLSTRWLPDLPPKYYPLFDIFAIPNGKRNISDTALSLPGHVGIIKAIAFDTQDTRIAAVQLHGVPTTAQVSILDVKTNTITPRASIHLPLVESTDLFELVWSQYDADLLGLTCGLCTYVLKLVGEELICFEINGLSLIKLQFSSCGRYICGISQSRRPIDTQYALASWPTLHRLPKDVPKSNSITTVHPLSIELLKFYVFTPYVFRLRWGPWPTGILLLDRRPVNPNSGEYESETYQSRVICIKPDGLQEDEDNTALIWPHEDDGETSEVKLLIVSKYYSRDGRRAVINTGIQSNKMMDDICWFTVGIGD